MLFRQGEARGDTYIVGTGAVALIRESQGRRLPLATVRHGEMFGEMGLSDGGERRATAVALEDSVVVAIPAAILAQKLAGSDPLVETLVGLFAANLRRVHDTYAPRPRSLRDHVNALSRQYDGVAKFLRGNVPATLRGEFERRLRALDVLAKDMRRLALNHRQLDRRDDAVPHEADLPP